MVDTVSFTIHFISSPEGICVSPDGTKLYVANYYSDSVSIINTATNTVSAAIAVGIGPLGISVSPDGSKVYVTNIYDSTISVINTTSNTVSATIPVGSGPAGVSISPDGSNVYIANSNDSSLSVINAATNTVSAIIAVGIGPVGVSVTPDGTSVYVANSGDSSVSVINTSTNTVSASITVGRTPNAFGNFIGPANVGVPSLTNQSPTLSLYPNPTNGIFTLKGDLRFTNYDLRITDVLGRTVYTQALNNSSQATIDISQCSNGVYFYQLTDGKGSVRGKLVKE